MCMLSFVKFIANFCLFYKFKYDQRATKIEILINTEENWITFEITSPKVLYTSAYHNAHSQYFVHIFIEKIKIAFKP